MISPVPKSQYQFSTKVETASKHNPSIVLELGNAFIKVGIAGEAQPRCVLPTTNHNNEHNNNIKSKTNSALQILPPLPSVAVLSSSSSSSRTSSSGTSRTSSSSSVTSSTNSVTYFYSHLSPFFHNLYTQHLYLKPKSKRIVILLPTHVPQAYLDTIQSILLYELNVPSMQFIHQSSLYTPIPYALGLHVGMTIDVGCYEVSMGVFFHDKVLKDTVDTIPCGYNILLQKVFDEYCSFLQQQQQQQQRDDDDDDDGKKNDNETIQMTKYEELKLWNFIRTMIGTFKYDTPSSKHQTHEEEEEELLLSQQQQLTTVLNQNQYHILKNIISKSIHELYFDLNNTQSLIYLFLDCIMTKCPLDLRCEVVRNICIIGGGVLGISSSGSVSSFESRFITSIQDLFEKRQRDDKDDEKGTSTSIFYYNVKNEKHLKFQSLAMLLMEKGPLSVIHPLPFSSSCINWVGGSVLASLNLSNEEWIYRR